MKNKKINTIITILTVISSSIALISSVSKYLLQLYFSYKFDMDTRDTSSIGIIGGSDGPTSILISRNPNANLITIISAILAVLGIIYLIFAKKQRRS